MSWIKTSERLPKEHDTVICYGVLELIGDKPIVEPGFWWKNDDNVIWSTLTPDHHWEEFISFLLVTHWMELPEPPK